MKKEEDFLDDKPAIDGINVSVVLDMVCGNTLKQS